MDLDARYFQARPAGFIGGRRPISFGHCQDALHAPNGDVSVVVEQRLAERADQRTGFSGTDQTQFGCNQCSTYTLAVVKYRLR